MLHKKTYHVSRRYLIEQKSTRLINVKTIHLGPNDILVTAKIDVKSEYEVQAPQLVNDIEKNMRAAFPEYKIYIYIETDKYKEDY